MTQHQERLPALGQPVAEGDNDFAGEHDSTAVDKDVLGDRDADREPESPSGWAGLDGDGPP